MLALGLVHSAWAVADVPVAPLIRFGSAAAGEDEKGSVCGAHAPAGPEK
jgi:hypothetical protein